MLILGLNAYHPDAAACLIRDGRLVAAAEEERFRRIKHWAGLPTEAIAYCLGQGGVNLADVDYIAVNRRPAANKWRRLFFVLRHRPALGLIQQRLRNVRAACSIANSISHAFASESVRARVAHVEHHLAHLASTFMVSGFEEAVCVSVDGFGDFASTAWGRGRGDRIAVDGRIYFPHSLGIFYSAMTQYLGFHSFGDEYKVMGLAPYGQPRYLSEMHELVRILPDGRFRLNLEYFLHHSQNVSFSWNGCAPKVGRLYAPALEKLLGPARGETDPIQPSHRDLACAVQAVYEEAFFALLNALGRQYGSVNLALAGGCALNSVANGKVYANSCFQKLYLPPACGDAGGAIGAALVVSHRLNPVHRLNVQPRRGAEVAYDTRVRWTMPHAYLGPEFTRDRIRRVLKAKAAELAHEGCSITRAAHYQELCARTARAIANGCVVGWYQGRMEWGPRALGNRSILGDPRRADMQAILNAKIKRRESFRPFAPAILREHVLDWFEQDDEVPFMTQVFRVRADKRALIPATTHVDGTGRLQTVRPETNALFYRLISEFYLLSGVPVLLNTSFNENEPIVCRPEEALDCFLRTKMDVLVMDQFSIERRTRRTEFSEAAPDVHTVGACSDAK